MMINKILKILIVFLSMFSVGCETKNISQEEAHLMAIKEVERVVKIDKIDKGDLKPAAVIENKEINGWEFYFEKNDKSYALNVLVTRRGDIEVHKKKTSPW